MYRVVLHALYMITDEFTKQKNLFILECNIDKYVAKLIVDLWTHTIKS